MPAERPKLRTPSRKAILKARTGHGKCCHGVKNDRTVAKNETQKWPNVASCISGTASADFCRPAWPVPIFVPHLALPPPAAPPLHDTILRYVPVGPCDIAGCLAARRGPLGSPFLLHRLPVTTTGARAFLLLACATRMAASRPLITTDDLCRFKERKTDSVAPRTSRYGIELVARSVNMTRTNLSSRLRLAIMDSLCPRIWFVRCRNIA